MFGNLGAFVEGNMFMGLFGSAIGVKLAEADAETLRHAGGGPFGPEGRPMSGYVTLPVACTSANARKWAEKSLAHVAALPIKKPKTAKAQKTKASRQSNREAAPSGLRATPTDEKPEMGEIRARVLGRRWQG